MSLLRHIQSVKIRIRQCFREIEGDESMVDIGELMQAYDELESLQRTIGSLRRQIGVALGSEMYHLGVEEVSTPNGLVFSMAEKPIRPTYDDSEVSQALVSKLVEAEQRRNRKIPPLAVRSIVSSVAWKILDSRTRGAWSRKALAGHGVDLKKYEVSNEGSEYRFNFDRESN